MIKLCMSGCLWRRGQSCHRWGSVFPKERLNVNIGSNEISAKETSIVSACPSMRSRPENRSRNPVCLRGGMEETCLEHRVPAKVKKSSGNSLGPLLVAEHEDIWRKTTRGSSTSQRISHMVSRYQDLGIFWAELQVSCSLQGKEQKMDVPLDWDLRWTPVWSLGLFGVVLRPSCCLRRALSALTFGRAVHIKSKKQTSPFPLVVAF